MGNPLIMGRRTFESIGRPLPGRTNIVVTRRADYGSAGIEVVGSLEDAVALARAVEGAKAINVIGGAEIYRQTMPLADRLHVTHIEAEPDGDTFMPPIDDTIWKLVASEAGEPHPDDSAPVTYATYERRPVA